MEEMHQDSEVSSPKRPSHFLTPSAQFQKRAGSWLGPSTPFQRYTAFANTQATMRPLSGGKWSSASLPSAASRRWARPWRTAMYECGQRRSPGSEAPLQQGDGSDDELDPTHATSWLKCTWGVVGRGQLVCEHRVRIHRCGGCHAACVCKWTERRPRSKNLPGTLG